MANLSRECKSSSVFFEARNFGFVKRDNKGSLTTKISYKENPISGGFYLEALFAWRHMHRPRHKQNTRTQKPLQNIKHLLLKQQILIVKIFV